jgi:glycosyltransferase involved in cell wall biosynthesis
VRIAFLNPSGELGGAETALLELLAALRAGRPAWSLSLVASAPGPLVNRASALGVSSISLPFPTSLARLGEWGRRGSGGSLRLISSASRAAVPTLAYERSLRRHLGTLGPDIVHTNGFKMHILGARCCPEGAHVLWHLHDYPETRPVTGKLLRAHAHRCSAIVANSTSVGEQAGRITRGTVPVHVIYNAVDLDRFTPDGPRLDLDALAGVPPLASDGVRVGLLGTFARWKGHDVFLKALSQLTVAVPVRGYVIGDSIYETDASQFSMSELQASAIRLGLKGKVAFTGRIDDAPAALRALDIVVHASIEPEPFGLVIAESMACARPVIVSRGGGAVEIAQGGAVFHTPGDPADLARQITRLALDAAERTSLGRAGREAAVRLFGRERLAHTLVRLYEAIH